MEIINLLTDQLGLPLSTIILIIFVSFSAGFVDAVVGGGGLIMVPGLLTLLPNINIPTLFGTNKIASITGTAVATYKFSRKVQLNWFWLLPAFIISVVCAIMGGKLATIVPTNVFRPIILFFLLWVVYLTFFPKKVLTKTEVHQENTINRTKIISLCGLIAFYDGFIGPGTGIFLIFVFVQYFGLDFLVASAHAKVINVASNVGALIYFIPNGHFIGKLAILLIICNVSGSYLGSAMAIAKGAKFVQVFFRVMVSLLLVKFIYDTIIMVLSDL